jgi:ABC-2 type transport system permease protein
MNPRRVLSLAKRILIGLLHERRTLTLVLLAPVIAMLVFGFVLTGEARHIPVVVVNLDHGSALPLTGRPSVSLAILAALDPEVVDLREMESVPLGAAEVEAGRAAALVVFPPDFTKDVLAGLSSPRAAGATMEVRLDRTAFHAATAVAQAAQDAVLRTLEEYGQRLPVGVDLSRPIYGAHVKLLDFVLPGILGFACFFLTALLTILSLVGERRAGTLERLLTTPLRDLEIVAGYAVLFGGIGVLQSLVLLGIATVVFKVTVTGSAAVAFLTLALLSVVSLSLGILLSTGARTELQAVQTIPLVVLPTFLLSGVFWPVEAIPLWLRPLSYMTPPYYAIAAFRSIMIRGWGITEIWPDLAALVGFAVLFLGGAVLMLRRSRL